MTEEILMLTGALIWAAGELIGVVKTGDSTTHYVRMTQIGRFLGTAFAAWLALHFATGVV